MKEYLIKSDKFGEVTFYDYDNCNYILSRSAEEPEMLKLGFNCNCFEQLMANGGQDMLNEIYKENLLPNERQLPNTDITLGIKNIE